VVSEAQWRADLAREATDRCLARALVAWATTGLGQLELADLLLDARPLAIAMADAGVAVTGHEEGLAALQAAAEGGAHEVFVTAITAREAEITAREAELGEGA
jgi:hypothetical protein